LEFDSILPKPLLGYLTMLLPPGREETNVMTLIIPFIDLLDRLHIGLSNTHQFRMFIVDMFTDAIFDV
jgi:hypothetical protein